MDWFEAGRLRKRTSRDRGLFKEFLTPAESSRSLKNSAARFAAKEALFKALGTGKRGKMSWHDVEVAIDPPGVVLRGATKELSDRLGVEKIHLDLASKAGYAAAVVVLEGTARSGRKRHGV